MADQVLPPPKPPAHDSAGFAKRLYERVRTVTGQPYAVFEQDEYPAAWKWTKSLRDTVAALCTFTGDIKHDVDEHAARLNTQASRLNSHEDRITALESGGTPFPG